MSRWFRVYSELIDDPKFIKLGPDLRSALLMTWCIAARNDGRLPPIDDIAIKFRLSEARAQKLVDELERSGFIDRDDAGLFPHNWNARQFKSDVSNERVKRFRERQCNVTSAVTETPPETEQKQITETEQKDCADAPPKVSRQKPKRSIPGGFEIAPNNAVYAKSLGFSDFEIKREHQKFCMSAKANARTYSDWHAAEHNWITKAAEFAGKRPRGEWDIPDDGMIEVLDQLQLEAWDAHGIATTGKGYPRNKKGGWRFPSKWPPGHEDKIVAGVEKILAGVK